MLASALHSLFASLQSRQSVASVSDIIIIVDDGSTWKDAAAVASTDQKLLSVDGARHSALSSSVDPRWRETRRHWLYSSARPCKPL